MSKPTIWINRTTSYNWNRPVVGIVRVETELAEKLKGLYPDGAFKDCIWDGKQFIELTQEKINNVSLKEKKEVSADKLLFPIVSKRQALLNIAQAILSISPSLIRPQINSVIFWVKPKVIRAINWFSLQKQVSPIKLKKFFKSNNANHCGVDNKKVSSAIKNESIFSSGDVLISIGLDWDHQFYKDFYTLRTDSDVKIITCCYDLIPVLYPQYCVADVANLFASYFIELADGSDEILCISQQSQRDLNNLLNRTGARLVETSVFELGDNVPSSQDDISDEVHRLANENFILFVSSIERRKNHEVIYRAYHLLCQEGKSKELPIMVFVGMPGWGVSELLKDIELDPFVKGKIQILNHVNDAELRKLYDATLFCVFPSLYEGWGLPVGEALALGKPVLCSNRGSLPEVGGNFAVYMDPWDTAAWAQQIYRLSTDNDYRCELSKKILSGYKKRTWENAALQVKSVIDKHV